MSNIIELKEYVGIGSLIISIFLIIGKKYLINFRRFISKFYKSATDANKIADGYIDKELNTLDKDFISMLKHHNLSGNIIKLISEQIPYAYLTSSKGKAQSAFALCSIILMETYGEQLETQFNKLIPNLKLDKQTAELEIMGQLRLTNTIAYEKMEKIGIPPEVIVIFFVWYNKASDTLFYALNDNLQMSKSLKDILKCTIHTCNYYTYALNSMIQEKMNIFNGEITKYLTDDVYSKIEFGRYKIVKNDLLNIK